MHHDNEGSFTTKKVDKELEKGIEGKCLVNVTEGIDPEGGFQRDQACPGSSAVYRDPRALVNKASEAIYLPLAR